MNCKKCNNLILEGDAFCKKCGEPSPLKLQKDKIEKLKERQRNLLSEKTHSPLFLCIAIFFSAMTLAKVSNLLCGNFSVLLESIFMIIATVGFWCCCGAKDNHKLAGAMRHASIHDAFIRVIYTIRMVVASIGVVLAAGLCFAVAAGASSIQIEELEGLSESLPSVFITIGIIFLVAGAVGIVIVGLFRAVYANRRAFFLSLSSFADTGIYTAKKAPVFGSFLFGGVWVINGVSNIFSAVMIAKSAAAAVAAIAEVLGLGQYIGVDMSGLGEDYESMKRLLEMIGLDSFITVDESGLMNTIGQYIGEYISSVTSVLTTAYAIMGVTTLLTGVYFIISAIWMKSVHNDASALRNEIDRENVVRLDMEREIRKSTELEAERVRIAAAGVAADELAKAREALKAQEELLKQMREKAEESADEPAGENNESPETQEEPVEEAHTEEAPAEETSEKEN